MLIFEMCKWKKACNENIQKESITRVRPAGPGWWTAREQLHVLTGYGSSGRSTMCKTPWRPRTIETKKWWRNHRKMLHHILNKATSKPVLPTGSNGV